MQFLSGLLVLWAGHFFRLFSHLGALVGMFIVDAVGVRFSVTEAKQESGTVGLAHAGDSVHRLNACICRCKCLFTYIQVLYMQM